MSTETTGDAKAFVAGLVDEMQQLFAQLGEHETLESESQGQVEVVTLLKLAMQSELEASDIAAYWLPSTAEIEAKTILAEQCADEIKHYNLIAARLEEMGEDLSGFDPVAEGYSPLYQYLRSLRTTVERIAAGPFACEAVAEIRNAQFITFCHSVGDTATAKLYEDIVHPEEIHHYRAGREYLEKHANTPEIQAKVATAMRSSLAIADELQTLTAKATGLHAIPVS
ncbi:MAG: ferritin-like domain-containing protein [Acidobacteriota bacterium]